MVHNRGVTNQKEPELKPTQETTVRPRSRSFRAWIAVGVLALFVVLGFTLALMPVPFVIQSPGPTVNVLGSQGDVEVLEFSQSGAEEFLESWEEDVVLPEVRGHEESDGQLRMVTVSELGGPGSTVRGIDWLQALFSPSSTVSAYSDLYDDSVTAEGLKEAASAQMTSSHSTSAIAAFEYLGIPMDSTLTVAGAVPGSDADGQVEEGDILVSLGLPSGVTEIVDAPSVPFSVMKTVAPGSTVDVTLERDGQTIVVPVVTAAAEGEEGSKLGIYLTAQTETPLNVDFNLERIGGPSAGLIFSLGIIDQLSDHDLTGGNIIAGTGAMSFTGDVMPIGGVKQKMYGASRDGAEWFLVPVDNCADVIGNEPEGLHVIPVSVLSEGVDAVEAIAAGEGDNLPTCEAAMG